MSLKQEAEGAPYYLTTSIKECPLNRFWVVLLDCGIEVYQNHNINGCSLPNAWMRLKKFCQDKNIKIVNMALADRVPSQIRQINLKPTSEGYFFAQRVRKILVGLPMTTGWEDRSTGVGEMNNGKLKIYWELSNGQIEIEERDLKNEKEPLSLIKN